MKVKCLNLVKPVLSEHCIKQTPLNDAHLIQVWLYPQTTPNNRVYNLKSHV